VPGVVHPCRSSTRLAGGKWGLNANK
jgi:hypothetical protein